MLFVTKHFRTIRTEIKQNTPVANDKTQKD
jgi:hypothetical protein